MTLEMMLSAAQLLFDIAFRPGEELLMSSYASTAAAFTPGEEAERACGRYSWRQEDGWS